MTGLLEPHFAVPHGAAFPRDRWILCLMSVIFVTCGNRNDRHNLTHVDKARSTMEPAVQAGHLEVLWRQYAVSKDHYCSSRYHFFSAVSLRRFCGFACGATKRRRRMDARARCSATNQADRSQARGGALGGQRNENRDHPGHDL